MIRNLRVLSTHKITLIRSMTTQTHPGVSTLVNRFNDNDVVQHYKGGYYKILFYGAKHTETEEPLVIYRSIEYPEHEYKDVKIWARPKPMFEGKQNVDGVMIDRFVKIQT